MIEFPHQIVIFGCGSVAQCAIPLLLSHLNIKPSQITVIDFVDNSNRIPEGIRYVQKEITKENYREELARYLKTGDLLLDLAWNIKTLDLLIWCKEHGVLYVNTSVEEWDPYASSPPHEKTLYHRQMEIRRHTHSWKGQKTPTAVLEHGANPGLISSLAKQGLIDIAHAILESSSDESKKIALQSALKSLDFAKIAFLVGLKTIHVSEKDTQVIANGKDPSEFVNTWSVMGLHEEGLAPAEMGWGTHEKTLPSGARTHLEGPQNQIFLDSRGIDTWVDSWVPSGPIQGMVIRHGEAFSLSEYLTYVQGGQILSRPTVHYAYRPCEETLRSLEELKQNSLRIPEKQRVLNDEIISGKDELGCLLLGHDLGAWWTGTVLDIDTSRTLVPHQSATTVQVGIGTVAAVLYAITHPYEGICLPEHLPHDFVLKVAKPYLGEFLSIPSSWKPPKQDEKKPDWQFTTFLATSPSLVTRT